MAFVLRAVSAVARDTPCPAPPPDESWLAPARAQGVLTVVVAALHAAGHRQLPEEARRARLVGAAAQLRAEAALRPLAAALDAAGLRWVVLKGPVLGGAVYRRAGTRTYGDLDLLVHPADLPVALDLLVPEHAELVDRNWAHLLHTGGGEIGLRLLDGTPLDLHWHLVNRAERRRDLAVPVTRLLARRQRLDAGGMSLWSLDPLDVVGHTALHGCLSGAHSLKWLLDLQQALQWADPDPGELRQRATETGTALALAVMLDRTARYLDPAVAHWAVALPRGPWRTLAAEASRRFPPGVAVPPDAAVASAVRAGVPEPRSVSRSGATVFEATRRTTARSLLRLGQQLTRNRLVRWGVSPPPERGARRLPGGGEAERRAWLALAASND